MHESTRFYIGGAWVTPLESRIVDVVDPATDEVVGKVALGGEADVDRAVAAAREAFPTFSRTTREERIELLEAIAARYQERQAELAAAVTTEMGAPPWLSTMAQVPSGYGHLRTAIEILRAHPFEERRGTTLVVREPIGVCALVTPWNWPLNQILCKVAPALAAGCTMVLKPSELVPRNADLVAEILHDAGVPAGVFNLVHGDGPTVGEALSAHPDVDMISFTGSTRAGILVAKAAADSVKRVSQELGGKSANLILDDADLEKAVAHGTQLCLRNSGQSCNAPTRMFVPRAKHERALEIAKGVAESMTPGTLGTAERRIGPVANRLQFERIQRMIAIGVGEGATLVTGGLGRPEGLDRGCFVRPTIFGNVRNDMTIAREEIFGPVLSILPYDDEEEAIRLANDTEYGLSAYVFGGSLEHALAVGSRLRAGNVHLNGAPADFGAPFGGYKKSGNGREWGLEGIHEFQEVKALLGAAPKDS
ncbi:MAG: aldehyde dehydrogenase family protein [Polyangiales bacterium]